MFELKKEHLAKLIPGNKNVDGWHEALHWTCRAPGRAAAAAPGRAPQSGVLAGDGCPRVRALEGTVAGDFCGRASGPEPAGLVACRDTPDIGRWRGAPGGVRARKGPVLAGCCGGCCGSCRRLGPCDDVIFKGSVSWLPNSGGDDAA